MNGFFITRTLKGNIEKYEQLMQGQPEGADIKQIYKNSDRRYNMTHYPFGTG